MKKGLVLLLAGAMVFAFAGVAMAAGNIEPSTYIKDDGVTSSVHPEGTWNSPYTVGIDGYNYNDTQDYTAATNPGDQVDGKYTAGPHGGYLTSTHKCRECHAVHRAAGKFKLTRSDTRFEACDWCHGTGAGSGANIQMDNDDNYTREYNVGHTMGFGVESGKWKAPDDTYPAYTPKTSMGGFSCFDCHSPHANPQRILGYNDAGVPVGMAGGTTQPGKVFGIANPGHAPLAGDNTRWYNDTAAKPEPIYLAGSWILIKNPDREQAVRAEPAAVTGTLGTGTIGGQPLETTSIAIAIGDEIPDTVAQGLHQFEADAAYPVNKVAIDWNDPIGAAGSANAKVGVDLTGGKNIWNVSEFCTDCHDGNAGLHTVQAPLFSEDRVLRNVDTGDTGSYDLAYGHDAQPRH